MPAADDLGMGKPRRKACCGSKQCLHKAYLYQPTRTWWQRHHHLYDEGHALLLASEQQLCSLQGTSTVLPRLDGISATRDASVHPLFLQLDELSAVAFLHSPTVFPVSLPPCTTIAATFALGTCIPLPPPPHGAVRLLQ